MAKATKDVYVEGIATIVPECVFIMHGRTKSNAADMGDGDSWWSTASNTVWVMCPQLMLLMLQIMLQVIEEIS